MLKIFFRAVLASAAMCGVTAAGAATPVRNIVIVHGAFADASGWRGVADVLVEKGFDVTLVQNPITSLQADVDATRRVLDLQDGPVLLVAHSYGGVVITEAGNRPEVVGLVYVAAYQPEVGESASSLGQKMPAAGRSVRGLGDGAFLQYDPLLFAQNFAADVPKADAEFMARSQVFPSKAALSAQVTQPAWRSRPSWAIVATEDRTINPDLERWMAARAGSKVVEIKGSHAVFVAQPRAVADVIVDAATELGR